jgi:hypothetical protein
VKVREEADLEDVIVVVGPLFDDTAAAALFELTATPALFEVAVPGRGEMTVETAVYVLVSWTTVVRTVVEEPVPMVYVIVASVVAVPTATLLVTCADGEAVGVMLDIRDDKLPGIGTAGDLYGERDAVTGQIVVYAAIVTVVTVVSVDSDAGQFLIDEAHFVIVISWVV